MLNRTFQFYKSSFEGLSRDIWILSLITLVNRSGTMVLPFLTVYMTADLQFTLTQAGVVMSFFGAGSMMGAYIGGRLTDRVGYYQVMFWSLFLAGFGFMSLMFIHDFWGLCIATFLITSVADSFRPANFASISAYSKPENRTRSASLLRLAVNLGFSVGPALGGILAASMGYHLLFLVDGLTCISAALLFRFMLEPRKLSISKEEEEESAAFDLSPYRDRVYWLFLIITTLNAMVFLQLFTTLPVFFREVFHFSESQIGYLLALNGFLIFLMEMPLVYGVERKLSKTWALAIGAIFIGMGFVLFIPGISWVGIVILSMLALTIGEMLNFPFAYAFAVDRASTSHQGQYMALFAMTFSFAHIVAPAMGMRIADTWGYTTLWIVLTQTSMLAVAGYFLLGRMSGKRKRAELRRKPMGV